MQLLVYQFKKKSIYVNNDCFVNNQNHLFFSLVQCIDFIQD